MEGPGKRSRGTHWGVRRYYRVNSSAPGKPTLLQFTRWNVLADSVEFHYNGARSTRAYACTHSLTHSLTHRHAFCLCLCLSVRLSLSFSLCLSVSVSLSLSVSLLCLSLSVSLSLSLSLSLLLSLSLPPPPLSLSLPPPLPVSAKAEHLLLLFSSETTSSRPFVRNHETKVCAAISAFFTPVPGLIQ